jgi:hypothetical protein
LPTYVVKEYKEKIKDMRVITNVISKRHSMINCVPAPDVAVTVAITDLPALDAHQRQKFDVALGTEAALQLPPPAVVVLASAAEMIRAAAQAIAYWCASVFSYARSNASAASAYCKPPVGIV